MRDGLRTELSSSFVPHAKQKKKKKPGNWIENVPTLLADAIKLGSQPSNLEGKSN